MSFDINILKKQLSPFGQKVLKVLVDQSRAEKAGLNHKVHQRQTQQQVKHHRESCKHSDLFDPFDEPNSNSYIQKKCTLKFLEKETSIISTPFELLNCKETTHKNDEMIMCRDDLVNSAIGINSDPYDESKREIDKAGIESIPIIDLEPPRVSTSDLYDVTWSNMFDIELFHDSKNNEIIQNNSAKLENKTIDGDLGETPIKTFKKPETKAKRKSTTKVNEPKPKKDKKLTISHTNFVPRKEKCTKAVKHWLNDVEKNTLPPILSSDTNETVIVKKKNEDDKIIAPKIVPCKEKSKKKVVQAQLANKEGKMKFGKPKNIVDSKAKETSIDARLDKDTSKENKAKSKFVAPIKSQIPVKDVTYDVITVDTDNVDIYADTLTAVASSDIFVVLIHRNGSSQLNCNYYEDSTIVDGIIVCVNDTYFCFKTLDQARIRQTIMDGLKDNTIVCFEGKHICNFLSHYDIKINNVTFCDTKIGGALLDPDSPPESFSDLQKLVSYTAEYTISTDCTLQKAAWYMTLLKETASRLRDLLIDNCLWKIFVDLEMRLLPIVADMERRGVSVDLDKLKSMEQILVSKLKKVEQECHKAAGRQFQVNSPLQIRALLYDELKLDEKCNIKIRETLAQGAKSTSEATLRSLISVHQLPKLILEYRHLHKAHATFLTGIAQHVKDGVVKPTWVQTAAATGRIASNNPNLQAIPKAPFSLIMFPESEDIDNPVLNFRSVYKSRPGYWLLAADFKHVECRVFAHAAADTALLDVLRSEQDLFRVLAAKWLNKSEEEVSTADRERTKRIVYASLYGAGARKLMDILDQSYEQTLAIAASFNRTFPSLKSFGRSVVAQCERSGGRLATLCGRARSFTHIASRDFAQRSHAERQAVNFIVQGSAADLCKMAMVLTSERLQDSTPPLRAHLLLQIHDELVWEVHDDDLLKAAAAVKDVMESCGRRCGLPLRLPVALAAGRSWAGMAPVRLL